MAGLPVGEDDNTWANLAQYSRNLFPVLHGVFDGAIGQVESIAPAYPKQLCRFCCFACTILGCAASSCLAAGQIEDGSAQATRGHAQKSAAAGLLYVISVCRDCEHIGATIRLCIRHCA
jgi:hypothetical protein